MGSAAPIEGFALVEKIHSLGIPCFNSPATISRLRDKALGSCLMSAHEVPTPKTLVIGGQYSVDALTTCIEGPPWVLKTRFSAKGLGVMLVDSRRALGSAIDTLLASHTQILMQEFVPERSGTDVRVIVAGGKALAAMERGASSSTEFRSNLFLGGQGIAVPLTEELSRIAEVATAALGLTIAGVDLLGGPGGFVVAEANTSPGLAGVSQVQGRNIAHDVLLTFKEILSTFEKEE
jgi:ribosomal protein S6--L-glutamate ligase